MIFIQIVFMSCIVIAKPSTQSSYQLHLSIYSQYNLTYNYTAIKPDKYNNISNYTDTKIYLGKSIPQPKWKFCSHNMKKLHIIHAFLTYICVCVCVSIYLKCNYFRHHLNNNVVVLFSKTAVCTVHYIKSHRTQRHRSTHTCKYARTHTHTHTHRGNHFIFDHSSGLLKLLLLNILLVFLFGIIIP